MSNQQPPSIDHPDGAEAGDPPAPAPAPDRRKILRSLAGGVAGLGLGLSARSAQAAGDPSVRIYGPTCTATGATSSARIGVAETVVVQAVNVFGQPLTFGGGRFRENLVGPGQATTSWTDNGDGTYTLTYTLPVAGRYSLRIKHRGNHISGSPFIIRTAAVPSGQSVARGALVTEGTVDRAFNIHVRAKDVNGHNITVGGATVAVDVTSGPPGFTPFAVPITDNGDGTYTGRTRRITSTGTYATVVTVNGTPIAGSPFTFYSFLASALSTVSAPSTATAGQPVAVTIRGVTLEGTSVTTGEGADLFSVVVTGPGNQPALVTGVDHQDGTYTYSFDATAAGAYVVDASIEGQPLVGSGATITVSSSTPVLTPSLCTAAGAGVTLASQNYFAHFVVTTVDQNGNVLYVPSAAVSATATTATTSWPVTVVDNGDGTYACKYLPTTTEPITVAITVDGTPIASSPFVGVAVRSSCHAPYCSLQSSTTEPVGPIVWTFTMLDVNAQPVLDFHDNFVLVLTNSYPVAAPIFQQQFPGVGQLAFYAPVLGTMEFRVDIVNDVNELTMAGTPSFTIFS